MAVQGARNDIDKSPLGDSPAGSQALPGVPDRKSGFIDGDATTMPGQYPGSLFGVPLPQSSANGSGGALSGGDFGGPADPTNMAGQYPDHEALSGVHLDVGGDGGTFQPPGTGGALPGDGDGTSKTMKVTGVDLMANTPHDVTGTVDGTGDWTATSGYYPDDEPVTGVDLPHALGAARSDYQPAGGTVRTPPHPNAMNPMANTWAPQPLNPAQGNPWNPPHPDNMSGMPSPRQIQGQKPDVV
jgi:hypothetical protein